MASRRNAQHAKQRLSPPVKRLLATAGWAIATIAVWFAIWYGLLLYITDNT